MTIEFTTDTNGYIRGEFGSIAFWCCKCEYYTYGNYCINCGCITRYATAEDVAGLDDAIMKDEG